MDGARESTGLAGQRGSERGGRRLTPERFDFEGAYGSSYDAIIRRVFPAYEALFPLVLSHIVQVVGEDAHVLVVGAGTGMELTAFASAMPEWRLTGVEPVDQMADQAQRKVDAAGVARRVAIHRGLTSDLPAGMTFDAATAICVMHFLEDDGAKRRFLDDIAARLAIGAPLVVVDAVGEPGSDELEAALGTWMRFVRFMGLSHAEQTTYLAQIRHDVKFVAADRVVGLYEETGFRRPTELFRAHVFRGWMGVKM